MRISLVEREAEERKRRQRRKKRRRARTLDSAIARPETMVRPQSRQRRAPAKRNIPQSQPQPQPSLRERERERGRGRERAAKTGVRAADASRARGGIRTGLIRLPALLILAGLIGLLVYGSVDARFFVYQGRVGGARHIKAEAIYSQAGVHEQNIFWIRPEKVAERILQIDGIKAVHVTTALPAEVSITVEEREPVVMWRAVAQQQDWWLDEEGRVLPYPGDPESPEMIFVVDSSGRQLTPGGSLQPAELVHSVQQLAAALPGTRIFFYDGERELSFTQQVDGQQWPVYVGDSADLPHKIQVLQVLTRYLQEQKIHPRYVDVRWADHPVYNAPGGTAAGKSE
jgi:cell division septal protein FtsQ